MPLGRSPVTVFADIDLSDPLSPTMQRISPFRRPKLTPSTA